MGSELSKLTDQELMNSLTRVFDSNKLLAYQPYQWQRDFHAAGRYCRERLLICGNGVGKSFCCCAELSMHATGDYPSWWTGVRFDTGGFEIWIGSINNEMQKDGPQKILLGPDLDESLGTGTIPAKYIKKLNKRQAGIKDVVDEAFIRHLGGGTVKIRFKTFEQGDILWQSGNPKIIMWDEEPNEGNVEQKGIFTEMTTRLVRNSGIFFGCRTPLFGMTQLIEHFMEKSAGNPSIRWFGATWDDAPHMKQEDKDLALAGYKKHEIETRSRGVVMMGEGGIFSEAESRIVIDPFSIPAHWARIKGIDFGLAHPSATAWLAHDRDSDTLYLYRAWRKVVDRSAEHIEAIMSGDDDWIPVSWPHDGEKRDRTSGERLSEHYRKKGVPMLSKSARYKNDTGGGQSVWRIVEEMRDREATGRFRVFTTCREYLEERRSYHHKDGVIVDRRDDLLKATFYAAMMLRFASVRTHRGGGEELMMAPFRTSA